MRRAVWFLMLFLLSLTALAQEKLAIPDLLGLDREEAVVRLQHQGLEVKVVELFSRQADTGKVLSQAPQAGTLLAPGRQVVLTIAKGPPDSQPQRAVQKKPAETWWFLKYLVVELFLIAGLAAAYRGFNGPSEKNQSKPLFYALSFEEEA